VPNVLLIGAMCHPAPVGQEIFGPLSKNNTSTIALCAGLPVKVQVVPNCFLLYGQMKLQN